MSANVSTTAPLSEHVREEIDRWRARFPEDQQRSAVGQQSRTLGVSIRKPEFVQQGGE